MLLRFTLTTLVVGGGLLLLSTPLFVVAWRQGDRRTIRSFAVSGAVIGFACGLVAAGSAKQVAQCIEAGNSDCVDSGAPGLQLVMIVVFLIIVWSLAWARHRD